MGRGFNVVCNLIWFLEGTEESCYLIVSALERSY